MRSNKNYSASIWYHLTRSRLAGAGASLCVLRMARAVNDTDGVRAALANYVNYMHAAARNYTHYAAAVGTPIIYTAPAVDYTAWNW